ncbi:cellulose synthase-like protein G2 [Chenopodium quinoa]|uniref:cellulose synthase-like protein G2 n=1 Tax=Chenopodium quinoa TaxID=63459 RepID=UPI000B7889F8|nr:cellulose synthase-like protein G2 [Chenopodium quinoa]
MANSQNHPLHHCHVYKLRAILNRTYIIFHIIALIAIFYYRTAFFVNKNGVPMLPWIVIFSTEVMFSFMWILRQPFYWRPVTRTVFPEKLPKDEELPGLDVFICTTDHNREPTFKVMNTVVSAMCLDYPSESLSVYLSDDGGASVTLNGMKEAWVFATWWLPFCKRYNIKQICPQAYFEDSQEVSQSREFIEDRNIIKDKYESFKQRVVNWKDKYAKGNSFDHPALIQVINENILEDDAATINQESIPMPPLVYLAREKRPTHPHHFKAGALNSLLRVSSTFSNSPYILVLDCDMYCNDPISARQAMCFHLDPKSSSSLGWVQYPQKFHNISHSDIYDSQMRVAWPVLWSGMDGLQGPTLSGSNFYIKRKALFGADIDVNHGNDIKELKETFGPSNEFLKSLVKSCKPNAIKEEQISSDYLQEAQSLASCTYEESTQWGKKIGFNYESVVEDVMTSFILQSKGWRSVYLNPSRPQFLGSATTNLDQALIQLSRWTAGLLQLGLSNYCPLFYSTSRMHIFQQMLYSSISFLSLEFLPVSCFAIVPPTCFFYGIPLYPKVSDPFFVAFSYVFISSQLKHLYEVICLSGGSISSWFNEQRISIIKDVTCYAYGTLECVMAKLGIREASFIPTNKVEDDDTTKWYQIGKYDFRTSYMFLVPIVTVVTLNLFCFVGGLARVIFDQSWDALFAQVFFSSYVLIMSFPVIEGMLLRMDNASVPISATLISTSLSSIVLSLGYFIFEWKFGMLHFIALEGWTL